MALPVIPSLQLEATQQRQVPVVEQCLVFCLLWKFYVIDCFINRRSLFGVFAKGSALSKQKPGPDPFQTDTADFQGGLIQCFL